MHQEILQMLHTCILILWWQFVLHLCCTLSGLQIKQWAFWRKKLLLQDLLLSALKLGYMNILQSKNVFSGGETLLLKLGDWWVLNSPLALILPVFFAVVAKIQKKFEKIFVLKWEDNVQTAHDNSKVTSQALQLTLVLNIFKLVLHLLQLNYYQQPNQVLLSSK